MGTNIRSKSSGTPMVMYLGCRGCLQGIMLSIWSLNVIIMTIKHRDVISNCMEVWPSTYLYVVISPSTHFPGQTSANSQGPCTSWKEDNGISHNDFLKSVKSNGILKSYPILGYFRTLNFRRVLNLKTTMKTCLEVSIWCGFCLTKTIFERFKHRFECFKKIVFFWNLDSKLHF